MQGGVETQPSPAAVRVILSALALTRISMFTECITGDLLCARLSNR